MSNVLTSSPTIRKVRSKKAPQANRTRKALQVLQVSASDQSVLVSSPGMVYQKRTKMLKKSEKNFKISEDNSDKKEAPVPRRSKRPHNPRIQCPKDAIKEDQDPACSKNSKIKSSRASKAKKGSTAVKKPSLKTAELNQTNIYSYISVGSKTGENNSEIAVDSSETPVGASKNIESCSKVIDSVSKSNESAPGENIYEFSDTGEFGMCVTTSVSDDIEMITSEVPTLEYWKTLAEERRKALELTLHENAQLQDELEVLEAENVMLKSTLRELEEVVVILKDSLE